VKTSDFSEKIKMKEPNLKEIFVNPREYKETTNPNEYLKTCELDTCVGLALVEDLGKIRKRGLTYINYDTSDCYDKDGICKLTQESQERGIKILEKIVSQFRGLEESKEFPKELEDAEKIRAYVVANRTKQEKAKKSSIECGLPDDIGEINPMFDFIINWFYEKNISVVSDGISKWKKEADKVVDKKLYPIHTKEIILHQGKINILYRDNFNKLLNSETYSHPI
jgi:hypothetical protein